MDLGYNGNGAGEFTEITETNMRNFDKLSNHETTWALIADGDLFSTFQADYLINGVEIIQRIIVYHQEKKISFEYDIPDWKGVKNRQLRFALPVNAREASISYDVPMGVSTVGETELKMKPGGWAWGGTYRHNPSETHPREVQNFVSANATDFGLTMSSGISVFDWIDPTVDAVTYPVLQAIMLSSHKSCHGEGNWYLQEGAHQFRFSITSHRPGWQNGYAFGIGNNHNFYTVAKQNGQKTGTLPASLSFIKTSSPFVLITAFKKADAGDQAVIRFVEMRGESQPASIQFFKPFQSVDRVDLIEEEQRKNEWQNSDSMNMDLKNHSIESYKVRF
jgi:alpha-mannosidase